MQTCRGSHTHTLVVDPEDKANVYVYGSGTSSVRSAEELAGCSGKDPKDDPNTALFSIDVIQVPLAAPREGAHRQPAAHLRRPEDRRDRRAVAGRRPRPGTQKLADDQPVPRHHGVPGDRPRRRRLLGQRHPARHLRSGESRPARSRRRQELRLLALGDVQQRRHEGRLHRRVGRRHAPRCRATDPPNWGADAIFDIVDRKLRVRAATTRCRRRRPSRRTASRTTARSSRCRAATSWCRPGIRAASRCSTSPTRRSRSRSRSSIAARSVPSSWSPAGTGRPTGTTATSTAPRSRAASTSSGSRRAST